MTDRRLRDLIKQSAVSALSAADVYPVVATARADVEKLLHDLHPVTAGAGLIRLGPAGDGGYLVPDDLDGIRACYSPGVGGIIGFERDCAARGMEVFMADGSVESPVGDESALSFVRKYVGAVNTDSMLTLDHWVASTMPATSGDLLLQIDIEGAEYETILSASEALLRRFRIITGEFHFLDQLWNRPYFGLVARTFEKILQTHACVHIHPNNCTAPVRREGLTIPPVMEFTFLRRDRQLAAGYATRFPHPLDADNTSAATVALPPCWYRSI